jgi:hypothetical protein
MADLTITAGNVKATNANTSISRGIAGTAVNAGQVVYADPADSYKLKPALSSNQTQAQNVVGVALNTAAADQPLAYATAGDVTVGSVLTNATVYVLGSAAGALSPSADLDASTNARYGTVVGIATSATNLRVGIISSGVQNP